MPSSAVGVVGERERAARVVVLKVVDFAVQDVRARLQRVIAHDFGQRRRERIRIVVRVDETGADDLVRAGPDAWNGYAGTPSLRSEIWP